MTEDSRETQDLLSRAASGDASGWADLLAQHRQRLRRMVALRLDPKLQGRIDPSDVIQETYLEAWNRLPEYLNDPVMPFFLWLRFLAGQKLLTLRRHHLGRQRRDAAREVPLEQAVPGAPSPELAIRLLGNEPQPSESAIRAEIKARLEEALDRMDPVDREVLVLRHLEQLSRAETALVMGMRESAVSKRYVRALGRLKDILTSMPGGAGEVWP